MYQLNLVLVEPEIPQNTGNVARTCAATGARLHLVEPMGFRVDNAKLKRAGLDYWHMLDITYYDSIDDFFAKTPGPFYCIESTGTKDHTQVNYPQQVYMLFGNQNDGLSQQVLAAHAERTLRLPMVGDARCLNLSNSVIVDAHAVQR